MSGTTPRTSPWILALVGVIPLVFVAYALVFQTELIFGTKPVLSGRGTLRLLASAGAALGVVWAVGALGRASGERLPEAPEPSAGWHIYLGWVLWASGLAAFLLFVVSPQHFYFLGSEDRFVENASAVLALGASATFAYAAIRLRRHHLSGWFHISFTALLAVTFFVLAGEEISWGQRVVGFDTPESFRANIQGETNLHNFATDAIEVLYYAGAFYYLIFLAFLHDRTRCFSRVPAVAFFIPGPSVLLTSTLIPAYTFDTWNLMDAQFQFFATLFIVLYYLYDSVSNPRRRSAGPAVLTVVALACVLVQAGFLALGDRQVRPWDTTEYKELLIAGGFLVYALEIARRNPRPRSSRESAAVE